MTPSNVLAIHMCKCVNMLDEWSACLHEDQDAYMCEHAFDCTLLSYPSLRMIPFLVVEGFLPLLSELQSMFASPDFLK